MLDQVRRFRFGAPNVVEETTGATRVAKVDEYDSLGATSGREKGARVTPAFILNMSV